MMLLLPPPTLTAILLFMLPMVMPTTAPAVAALNVAYSPSSISPVELAKHSEVPRLVWLQAVRGKERENETRKRQGRARGVKLEGEFTQTLYPHELTTLCCSID